MVVAFEAYDRNIIHRYPSPLPHQTAPTHPYTPLYKFTTLQTSHR